MRERSEYLTEREMYVLDNHPGLSYQKIGVQLGITAERVRQIKQQALRHVREEMPADGTAAFKLIKADFDAQTKGLKKLSTDAGKKLSNVFQFCEEVFPEGQEMLILVTELTISYYGAHFISRYGCKEYFAHNKELLFYERQKEIIIQLDSLNLDE